MVVTIHQPEHFPWLGFFEKLAQADLWISLDTVSFRKNYYQNRNRLRGPNGPMWLTTPVLTKGKSGQAIKDVRINTEGEPRWREKCWATLSQLYARAPHWPAHAPFFREVYHRAWTQLIDFNEAVILYLCKAFGIRGEMVRASALAGEGQGTSLLLDLCLKTGAQTYLSGVSGRDYLDEGAFREKGIDVRFQEFHHPIYPQAYDPFLPCMSAVDLLFQVGPRSGEILRGVGVPTMEKIFL